jgi:membrane protease subunit HflK
MPWSNQGGGGGPWQGGGGPQGPWGRGPGGPQPPDLEDLLRKGQDRVRQMLPGGLGGGRGIAVVVALIVAIWAATGFYRVLPDEQGVELVFGKWVQTTQAGLNYNFPAPIGEVFTPKVTRVNRVDIGYRSEGGTASTRSVPTESLMLTGDENIIDINFVVFWVIEDAGKYLFNIRQPDETVKDVAESAMREVVGKQKIGSALAEGRSIIEVATLDLMQRVLDAYESGIRVTQVELQKVDPPAAVIDAFRDVQAARADKDRFVNQAEAYRNSILPVAQGEAVKLTQEAEAYKQETINRALGEANRFTAVYNQYVLAKDVTKRRLYLETMQDILSGMNKIIIDSAGTGTQGVLPYLPLPELQRQPGQQTTTGGSN